MSLMDLFRKPGPPTSEDEDSVWLTRATKLHGLQERALRHPADGQVLVLAHFPDTLAAVEHAQRETAKAAREPVKARSSEEWMHAVDPIEPEWAAGTGARCNRSGDLQRPVWTALD